MRLAFVLLFTQIGVFAQISQAPKVLELTNGAKAAMGKDFKLLDKNGTEVQCQISGDNLLVFTTNQTGKLENYTFKIGQKSTLPARTFCRYVPERLDDFAWENDKIAFRAYGKALEGTKGDAYGFDVWVKRTSDLIIDRRYAHGDYHNDLGDGLDYYKVGYTLGAGNNAPLSKNGIAYSKNYHRYQILENGPIRTSFILEYDPWLVDGKEVRADKKFIMDAGSQFYRLETTYFFEGMEEMEVVAGIVSRPGDGAFYMDENQGIMAYWEPEHGKDGTTGVALTGLKNADIYFEEGQWLAKVKVKSGEPLVYYVGAAWDKAGEISSAQEWFEHCKLSAK